MNVTIIGAGNAGTTVAADLALRNHRVTLLKTSNKLHNAHFEHIRRERKIVLEENGVRREAEIYRITTVPQEALTADTDLVIIYVQTNYHEQVIRTIVPYLHDGEIILFEPGYLSTAYLLKHCDKRVVSVEAESSPVDCRITQPGHCTVLFRNVRNPIGIFPHQAAEATFERLAELGYRFTLHDSVVEASLHNPNLIVHTIGAIMSIPRIEYTGGEYWMYREVFTPKVCNLVERLDAEKNEILGRLHLPQLSYFEACRFRNSESLEADAKEVFIDYAMNHSPKGPEVPDSRYVTEDVSQGLCLLESLGHALDVKTPVATALIDLSSALLGTDFRMAGRSLENLQPESVERIVRDGAAARKIGGGSPRTLSDKTRGGEIPIRWIVDRHNHRPQSPSDRRKRVPAKVSALVPSGYQVIPGTDALFHANPTIQCA